MATSALFYLLEIVQHTRPVQNGLEKAIETNPRHFLTYYNYGGLCVEMLEPDIERAEEIMLAGASCLPENFRSLYVFYHYLGVLNMKREPPRYERALEFFRKSRRLKKSEDENLTSMAGILIQQEKYDEALGLVRKVLERSPGNGKAIRLLKMLRNHFQKRGS